MPPESRFSAEKKRDIVLEYLSGKRSVAEICREHQVTTTSIHRWRDAFIEAGTAGFEGKRHSKREKALEEEIESLKTVVGDLAVADHILEGGAISMRMDDRKTEDHSSIAQPSHDDR